VDIIEPSLDQLNKFAFSNPYGNIFHTGHIVNVFTESAESKIIKLAAIDNQTEEVLATMVIPLQKIPKLPKKLYFGVSRVTNPLILPNDEISVIAGERLLEEYDKISKKNIVYSKIRMSYDKSLLKKDIWLSKSYVFDNFDNFTIDLTRCEDEVWKDLSSSPKRRIRQGENKFQLTYSFADKPEDMLLFYKMTKSTYEKANIQLPDFSHFKAIYKNLCDNDLGKLLLIDYNGKKIAGRIILTYKKILYDWYAASLGDYAKIPANVFAVWSVLKWGIENKYDIFDFGGVGDPKKYLGFREFKRGFGGKYLDQGIYTKIQKPYYYKLIEMGKSIISYGVKKKKK
jgi:hypothetical protein